MFSLRPAARLGPVATLMALVGCGTTAADPVQPATLPGDCQYPEGAVEPMAEGEVLSAYSWPTAIHMSDGREAALDLAHVPCATDPDIDWSPFDVLLFVSTPAW